ncbi:helix-turn-helix transcriptional regulator [Streptacidiphilus sp. N1-10]|uniref:Helix-turn-helix transcriptional regulator n=1 Tax=Streptacidiphilus jeojiensis TaxID=3229225 RepID=A0ABV6XSK6_9ACTN
MSLPHAILTALLERPSSGLELTRRFDRSIGYFWSATHQQIYRELGKLEQGGLIEAVPQPPSRGQRKEYRVLPDGRAELVRWVAEGQDPKPVRDPLLLRLRAAAVVGTAGLDVELQRHLAEHRRQLEEYLEIEQRDFPADGSGGGDRLHHLVLKAGIALETFWVQWLAEAVGELAGVPAADEAAGPGQPGIAG